MIDMHPELREQLGAMACPCCYQRGMLTIELRAEVPYLVCSASDCGFVKAPEHVISD